MTRQSMVIASPHQRNDALEHDLRAQLTGWKVVRMRDKAELRPARLSEIEPTYVFFPHWSWLVPPEVFENFECVMFHMSALPYGRGGSPLQNLILRGHKDTRLTAFRCVAELDAGPIYLQRPLSLSGSAEEILSRASELMNPMIAEIVVRRPSPVPQSGDVVTFRRRTPSESRFRPMDSLDQAYDFIRMLDARGYPKAFVDLGGVRLTLSEARRGADSVKANVEITVRKSDDA